MTKSGIYSIGISKSNKDHIIKAFDIFNLKSSNEKVTKLMEFIKESSISQANLETVFLEVKNNNIKILYVYLYFIKNFINNKKCFLAMQKISILKRMT